MTDHEMLLLRAAVQALGDDFLTVAEPRGWPARAGLTGGKVHEGTTLADALTALLRDLGADVPEWPSEERVVELLMIPFVAEEPGVTLPEYLALRGRS